MENKIPKKLLEVYKKFDNCKRCKRSINPLKHILGGGKFKRPQFLFLFINPTHSNIASHQDYQGKRRFPFIGVRHFYRLLSMAGFMDKAIIEKIYKRKWQTNDENIIEQSLIKNNVYITNLIKCTQSNPDNPKKQIINDDFSLIQEEIKIVSPKYIVTFGNLVFKAITNRSIVLKDCLKAMKVNKYQPFKSIAILGKKYNVLPCYFPIGRGNPKKAVEILTYIKKRFT
ncbi:MAG: hypothetical protein KAS12_02280 [Candidatus Aenigmarchaeota archaeon]|nr:hypothetical protein [Candidatus Aenigmarchaeota archaeon]